LIPCELLQNDHGPALRGVYRGDEEEYFHAERGHSKRPEDSQPRAKCRATMHFSKRVTLT
jgi:hypothetical protein